MWYKTALQAITFAQIKVIYAVNLSYPTMTEKGQGWISGRAQKRLSQVEKYLREPHVP